MAIGVGTTTRGTSTGTASLSFAVTVPSGTTMLMIQISHSRGADSISGNVTFDGVNATRQTASFTNVGAYIYTLQNPNITTANVVVPIAAGTDRALVVSATPLSGTKTSSPIGNVGTANGTGTAISVAVTTTATNSFVFDCATGLDLNTMTLGGGQTQITNQVQAGTAQSEVAGASYESSPTATAVTMSWTMAGSAQWDTCAVEIKEEPGAAVAGHDGRYLSLLGVGN